MVLKIFVLMLHANTCGDATCYVAAIGMKMSGCLQTLVLQPNECPLLQCEVAYRLWCCSHMNVPY